MCSESSGKGAAGRTVGTQQFSSALDYQAQLRCTARCKVYNAQHSTLTDSARRIHTEKTTQRLHTSMLTVGDNGKLHFLDLSLSVHTYKARTPSPSFLLILETRFCLQRCSVLGNSHCLPASSHFSTSHLSKNTTTLT